MDNAGDMLRGNTHTIILAVLDDGPQHGYAIAQEVNRRTNNTLTLRQGALYPALRALERDGLIAGEWEIAAGERPRRVYLITDEGKAELTRRTQSWSEFANAMESVLRRPLREEPA